MRSEKIAKAFQFICRIAVKPVIWHKIGVFEVLEIIVFGSVEHLSDAFELIAVMILTDHCRTELIWYRILIYQ